MNDRPMPEGFPKLDKQTRVWKCRRDDPTCTRTAPCAADRGARNRRKGLRQQREARKTLERVTGTRAGRFASQTANEELWRLSVRVEAKAGKQVAPVARQYVAARAQSDHSHATGDPRPFVFVAVPDGWPAGKFLLTVHSDDLDALGLAIVGDLA